MATPKKYFHDHFVLLLLTLNAFLMLLVVVLVLSRLASQHTTGHIVQYRSSLGSNGFKSGSVSELLGFVVFALIVFAGHGLLSLRTYRIHRQLSITILGLGVLLLVLTIIVSNALLVL
jgi:hypothetical protein